VFIKQSNAARTEVLHRSADYIPAGRFVQAVSHQCTLFDKTATGIFTSSSHQQLPLTANKIRLVVSAVAVE